MAPILGRRADSPTGCHDRRNANAIRAPIPSWAFDSLDAPFGNGGGRGQRGRYPVSTHPVTCLSDGHVRRRDDAATQAGTAAPGKERAR